MTKILRENDWTAICGNCGYETHVKLDYNLEFDGVIGNPAVKFLTDADFDIGCPVCDHRMYAVDSWIAPQIKRLNQLGYITRFSCGGHEDPGLDEDDDTGRLYTYLDISVPYVAFDGRQPRRNLETLYRILLDMVDGEWYTRIHWLLMPVPEDLAYVYSRGISMKELYDAVNPRTIPSGRWNIAVYGTMNRGEAVPADPRTWKPIIREASGHLVKALDELIQRLEAPTER